MITQVQRDEEALSTFPPPSVATKGAYICVYVFISSVNVPLRHAYHHGLSHSLSLSLALSLFWLGGQVTSVSEQ